MGSEVKPSRLERAIAVVSPRWAAQRARHRMALNLFEAASTRKRTKGWRRSGGSIQADTRRGLAYLRMTSRELAQNNAYAEAAHREIPSNVVGTGIIPTFANKRLDELAKQWFDTTACDADGRMDFYGLERLIMRTVVESGECIVRQRRRRAEDGLPVPLQIQVLEPDHIDTSKDGQLLSGGRRLVQGIELDSLGRRIAYWLFRQHPGDATVNFDLDSVRVPADQVLHIFDPKRAGQMRGYPWGHAVLVRLNDFRDYADAQLVKQKTAAAFAGFVEDSDFPAANQTQVDLPEAIEPGMIEYLGGGRKIHFTDPPRVDGYADYSTVTLHEIATGYGVPYSVLTGDLRQVNFSSGRMGDRVFNKNVKTWQRDVLINQLCRPVGKWFMEAAMVALQVREPASQIWTAPRRELTDPAREIPALRDQVRSGFMTWAEAVREMGYDPDDFVDEAQAWNKIIDDHGLVFDSDPRKVSAAGLTQARSADSELPPTSPTDNTAGEQP